MKIYLVKSFINKHRVIGKRKHLLLLNKKVIYQAEEHDDNVFPSFENLFSQILYHKYKKTKRKTKKKTKNLKKKSKKQKLKTKNA